MILEATIFRSKIVSTNIANNATYLVRILQVVVYILLIIRRSYRAKPQNNIRWYHYQDEAEDYWQILYSTRVFLPVYAYATHSTSDREERLACSANPCHLISGTYVVQFVWPPYATHSTSDWEERLACSANCWYFFSGTSLVQFLLWKELKLG